MKSNRNTLFTTTLRRTISGLMFWGLALGIQAQDTNLNFQAVQAAAAKGEAKAQYELARCYARGIGVEKDDAKAAQYLRQSADQGNAEAQIVLGAFYGEGRGVPQDLTNAVACYRKAADQGNATAQYAMGNFYADGRGVTNDMDMAIQWWQKAAEGNLAEAQATLGEVRLIPVAVYGNKYVDHAEALRWLHRAATQGSAPAMNNLGAAYENGLGVKLDFKEAARWYRAAAEQGNALAQANLGQLYFDGRGVPYDLMQAYKWFKLSANQGNSLGIVGFNNFKVFPLLSSNQTAQAEQMVLDFQSRPTKSQP